MNNETKPISFLSLAIAAISLTVIVIFLFPWIDIPESGATDPDNIDVLTGISIATDSTSLTEDILPSGILFVMPVVAAAFLFEYYRKVRSDKRPRRRLEFAGMVILGIGITVYWALTYADAASECLRSGVCSAASEEQRQYSAQDVIFNLYTINLWIYLALSLLLLVLPFWDRRPQAPRSQ